MIGAAIGVDTAPISGWEPAYLGVAVLSALFGVAVDLVDCGIDVQERELVTTGQQRHLAREPGQHLASDRVQLAHVAPGKPAQERA